MSEPLATATECPENGPVAGRPLNRRDVLKLGAALMPCIIGAPFAAQWVIPAQDAAATTSGATGPALPAPAAGVPAGGSAEAAVTGTGRRWGFVVDVAKCIGCGSCVDACKLENHVPLEPEYNRTWVERHAVAEDGRVFIDSPDGGIHGFPPEPTAPEAAGQVIDHAFFMPRLCMQCDNPPCVAVCPVSATYKTGDGVVLVDQSRCIGCGYCVVACPYGARYLTPAGEHAPNDTPGIADKCTWCYHRISRGAKPACVEVCPVGARRFGDANEPDSEIATLVRERNPKMLHPEFGTRPRVLYLGPSVEEA